MRIDLPDFFIFSNEFSLLNSCEQDLISKGFGHSKANFSQMGYISRGKIKVEFSKTDSGQSTALFSTEKYSKFLTIESYTKNEAGVLNNNIVEFEVVLTPRAKTIDIFAPFQLCKDYHCHQQSFNMEFIQANDLSIYDKQQISPNLIKSISPSSFILGYNCIGWALGVETWINPTTKIPKTAFSNGIKLATSVSNFIEDQIEYFKRESNSHLVKLKIMENFEKISCLEPISFMNFTDGAIAFYFQNYAMTHAARYTDKIGEQSVKAWTSKLGQSFLVWHELNDLNEGKYGEPLCYALPGTMENHHINIDGSVQ